MTTNAKETIINEFHAPIRRNFPRRRVEIKSLYDLYAADLIEMRKYAKMNKNYNYLLVVINCFSKLVFIEPLKKKEGKLVSLALEKIFQQYPQFPKNFQTDDGKEFWNKDCDQLYQKYNINQFKTFSPVKCGIIERVNRKLKNMIFKECSLRGNYKYINTLSDIVDKYNNSYHRTIRCKPIEVNEKNEKEILSNIIKNTGSHHAVKKLIKEKFKIGDYVRISKYKSIFDKSYHQNWSSEVFKIVNIMKTIPVTYLLEDAQKEPIFGCFYEQELQKVAYPDVYLIEKVIRKGKNGKLYVKWLGLSKDHNSWIKKSDMR